MAQKRHALVLIGNGHLVRASEIVAVFQFHTGQGSTAVYNLVAEIRVAHARKGTGARVWDVSGHLKRRSAIVLRNGDVVLSWLKPGTILRRMGWTGGNS